MDCPRCRGGCSIVCCALCKSSGVVTEIVAREYEASDKELGTAIRIRKENGDGT